MLELNKRLALIRQKHSGFTASVFSNPLRLEFEQRIGKVESILAQNPKFISCQQTDQLLISAPMTINELFFEIARCESIIGRLEQNEIESRSDWNSSLVFPSLGQAMTRRLIEIILRLRYMLSASKTRYFAWSIGKLIYVKNNIQFNSIIKNLIFRFRRL